MSHTDPKPHALVLLTLSLSSPSISLDVDDEADPFYIIVTGRVTSSAQPSSPIVLADGDPPNHVSPLTRRTIDRTPPLPWAVHNNLVCSLVELSNPEKEISVSKKIANTQYSYPPWGDLREMWNFLELPSEDSGDTVVVRHQFPRSKLIELGAESGERYTVSFGRERGYFVGHEPLLTRLALISLNSDGGIRVPLQSSKASTSNMKVLWINNMGADSKMVKPTGSCSCEGPGASCGEA